MKKVTNRHPLESQIQAFGRSPLGQLKMSFKDNQDKCLKKISRNRLHRQPTLPFLNKPTSKSNQENAQPLNPSFMRQASLERMAHRNRSYMKTKTVQLGTPPTMSASQKRFKIGDEMLKVQKNFAGNQSRGKMVVVRNCMSAELKKESQDRPSQLPEKVKELRRVLHKKKSNLDIRSPPSQQIQIPLVVQAQRLAYQNKNKEQMSGGQPFLQDFLNEWKELNLS